MITEVRSLAASFPNSTCLQVDFVPETQGLGIPLSKVGFPIRTSTDQSFFAAPHGFSQRSTSFIASQRQGIHRTPLRHLIALIINTHPLGSGPNDRCFELALSANRSNVGYRFRKTSLSSDRSDGNCGQALADIATARPRRVVVCTTHGSITFDARSSAIVHDLSHARRSERSYLFTMSDITRPRSAVELHDGCGIVFRRTS